MWNTILPGIDETFYDFAFWFIAYSILGWIVESIYISYTNKKLTNRGFVHGPFCPIYGFGGIMVHTILKPVSGNWVVLFFLGMLLATSVEYATARVMIRMFGCVWWDYSNKPFNYKGILCAESCIVWGLYSIMDFAFLKDTILIGVAYIPYKIGKLIILGIFVYYLIDFSICVVKGHRGDVEAEENNSLRFS